ncbi:MAG: UvrD-helicase domain-containing protein [Pseudomonadales bacterium]|nr:UvrD-helicase domain-containing protein [Pseudomonadales bacterium]
MTGTSPIADAMERTQALDISRSFCVQAPAGSGKTELLTQRILKLLAHCAKPEEILAITFTRKAAAEMRNRLLDKLQEARNLGADDMAQLDAHERLSLQLASEALRQDEAQGWQLLDNTSRLRITTIDSFNSFLTRQLPISAGFGSQPEINEDMLDNYQQAVRETMALLEGATSLAQDIALLLSHLGNNLQNLQKLFVSMLAKREQWLENIFLISHHTESARTILENNLCELAEENLEELGSRLTSFADLIGQLMAFARDNMLRNGDTSFMEWQPEHGLPETKAHCLPQWQLLCRLFLTNEGKWRSKVDIRQGFPAPGKAQNGDEKKLFAEHKALFAELRSRLEAEPELLSSLLLLKELPATHFDEAQWQVLSALTRILPVLAANLDVVLREKAQVDYIKLSNAALDALGSEDDPSDLALRLDYRIQHILVDEFQDTSSQQIKLLEKLCYGWTPGDGRSLFIVGDGMQSCYAFRNANVGLFLAARDHGIGAVKMEGLQLKVNFRSDAAVVHWVNQVFGKAFPGHDDIGRGAVRYSPSVALHQGNAGFSGVSTELLVSDKNQDRNQPDGRLEEARRVVQRVQELQGENPLADIAILVRNRSHLAAIVPALRQASLAWNATDIDPLNSYPEITDLLSLCKALLNPADTSAWLALLRCPWAGLALKDIHALMQRARANQVSLWTALRQFTELDTLSADACVRLERIVPILEEARSRRQGPSLRDWLEDTWIALGAPAALPDNVSVDNIEAFFQALEKIEDCGDVSDMHRFEEKLGSIYGNSSHAAGIKLHIMTIHKAKGLEFDFVIVPGLERKSRNDDSPLLLWKEHISASGQPRLLISLLRRKGDEDDSVYRYLKYEALIRSQMENTRLLYIAITRAAKKAFLIANVSREGEEYDSPNASSLLASIWPQLEEPGLAVTRIELGDGPLIPAAPASPALPEIVSRRLPATWVHPGHGLSYDSFQEAINDDDDSKMHHHLLEKRIGEIIHESLKTQIESGMDWRERTVNDVLKAYWRNVLIPYCSDHDSLNAALERIARHLTNCRNDSKAAWLFNHRHRDSACELALSDYSSGHRREYIIDRTFVDADDTRWIIDYKSSTPEAGQHLDDFVKEQSERYYPQLQTYARLFARMETRQLRTALFFTAIPLWHEVVMDDPANHAGP